MGDAFDKTLNLEAAEIAMMTKDQRDELRNNYWKKQRRNDTVALISAIGGAVIGCVEAWLYYNDTIVYKVIASDEESSFQSDQYFEGSVRSQTIAHENNVLMVLRIICSIMAFTAGM